MNKKGFTLIEVLAVIVILSVIALIVFPEVNKIIKDSRQKSFNTQVDNLITATKKIAVKDTSLLPSPDSGLATCVTLTDLMNAGEIETDIIKDPRKSNENITGVIVIQYAVETKSYVYSYKENCPN